MARQEKGATAASIVRERLRLLRQQRGLTQEELAEQAGVSVDAVTRIESGKRSPRLDTLERLASALAVSVHELVARDAATRLVEVEERTARIQAMLRGRPEEFLAAVETVLKAMTSLLRR